LFSNSQVSTHFCTGTAHAQLRKKKHKEERDNVEEESIVDNYHINVEEEKVL
jgi:hypothetical protein